MEEGVYTMTDHTAIDLKLYKQAVAQRERLDHISVQLTATAMNNIIAAGEGWSGPGPRMIALISAVSLSGVSKQG